MTPALRLLLDAQALLNAGELGRAAVILDSLVRAIPDAPDVHNLRAILALRQGRYEAAAKSAQAAIALAPTVPNYHNTHGEALRAQGALAEAAAAYERAIASNANYVQALNNLGTVRAAQGRVDDAEACWRRALTVAPEFAGALNNLGSLEHRRGRLVEALAIYRRALAVAPNDPEMRTNVGNLLRAMGEDAAATASYALALKLDPDNVKAHQALGNALLTAGEAEKACEHFAAATALAPGSFSAWFDLASGYLKLQQFDGAQAALERAVSCEPRSIDAHVALAAVLRSKGRTEDAAARYKLAIAARPDRSASAEVLLAMLLPMIPRDVEAIDTARARFRTGVEGLIRRGIRLDDFTREVAITNFDLAYHGRDDRRLQQLFAEFCLSAQPSLAWIAPHCRHRAAPATGRRLRVGFYGRQLAYGHSVWQTAIGFIEGLDRSRFDVTVVMPGGAARFAPSQNGLAIRAVDVPGTLAEAREAIAALELDVLVHCEIGMDALGYALGFARLAPVQCVLMGHPVTTGIPTIDYFISGAPFEPPDADSHYSESLIQLSTNFACFHRPQPPVRGLTRDDFGLPTDRAVYLCPQTLFKIHPDFDAMLAAILVEDRRGVAVLMPDNRSPEIGAALMDRMAAAGVPRDRVIWVDRMPQNRFFALLELCDAVLDTPHFNGGTSSLQAFSLGVPIVTLPARFLRGRFT
ncbi:MAG: tetratricopeptide repeat protein, partial [Alphaproteobacteria bacterium]|nr:tetratricopeptide repeat protein [Alphaproteobacteria bacterium]